MTIRAGTRRAIVGRGASPSSASVLFDAATHVNSIARQLVSTYAGNLLRVRDTTTATETNIGQAAGELDQTALLAALPSGHEGRVVTIFSQSGGVDLTQATTAAQTRIATGGVVDTMGGKPAAQATATTQGYRGTLGAPLATAVMTAYYCGLSSSALSSTARLLSGFTAAAGDSGAAGNFPLANSGLSGSDDQRRSPRSGASISSISVPPAAANAIMLRYDGSFGRITAARFATGAVPRVAAATATLTWDILGWGATSAASLISHSGQFHGESAVWVGRCLTDAEVAVIFANAVSFWSL